MNILLIGSGGRENALALAIAKSDLLERLYAYPGNPGIASVSELVDLDLSDFSSITHFVKAKKIDLVIVGPEQPLVDGLSDYLKRDKINVFGCSAAAAQLESSKSFTKKLCDAKNIKTAAYSIFTDSHAASTYLIEQDIYPVVIKADGLAAGKGVVIAQNQDEALTAVEDIFSGKYGKQTQIVIEEFLEGVEASFFALTDGKTIRSFSSAGDHKKIYEDEKGPNTGGMGTYSPSPFISNEDEILRDFIQPSLDYLNEHNIAFNGVLFLGLILTKKGPYLLEYNVRFGDPEAQSILPRLQGDFLAIAYAVATGKLSDCDFSFSADKAITVVLAAKGYPNSYNRGTEIKISKDLTLDCDIIIYHAGTKISGDKLLANGGRVLNVTSCANDYMMARKKVYAAIDQIKWEDCYYRKDIAKKLLS